MSDGYVLVGNTAWTDTRLADLSPQITAAQDADGHVIPIEPAYLGDLGIDNPAPNQWAYKLSSPENLDRQQNLIEKIIPGVRSRSVPLFAGDNFRSLTNP
jgi:hypothetical protein